MGWGGTPETACAGESLVTNSGAGIPAAARRRVGGTHAGSHVAPRELPLRPAGAGRTRPREEGRTQRASDSGTIRDALLGTQDGDGSPCAPAPHPRAAAWSYLWGGGTQVRRL